MCCAVFCGLVLCSKIEVVPTMSATAMLHSRPVLYCVLLCRMDVDFSSTGKEFVTGSYDRTVSVWRKDTGM